MHYHFQNKLGVIQALVELIARELASIAGELRTEKISERSMSEACRNTLRPLVLLPERRTWGSDAVRFLSRMVSEGDAEIAAPR